MDAKPDAESYAELAERCLKLWQRQLESLATDPEQAAVFAAFLAPTAPLYESFAQFFKESGLAHETAFTRNEGKSRESQTKESQAKEGQAPENQTPENQTRADASFGAEHALLLKLADRLDLLAERLSRLEQAFNGRSDRTPKNHSTASRSRRTPKSAPKLKSKLKPKSKSKSQSKSQPRRPAARPAARPATRKTARRR